MRAVLLEMSHSIITDSPIMTILRFFSREVAASESLGGNRMKLLGTQHQLTSLAENKHTGRMSGRHMQRGVQWNFSHPTPVTDYVYKRSLCGRTFTPFNLQPKAKS